MIGIENFPFVNRHIGPSETEITKMLENVKAKSLDDLTEQTLPDNIKIKEPLKEFEALSEREVLAKLKYFATKNKVFKSFIGMGYYGSVTPSVIKRNILQNPGWYTQYTPYQAEISQGRLEALFNFQTVICDLTSLPISNASLLDEGTAAAEAMLMFNSVKKNQKAQKFFVDKNCFPQTIAVVKTRAYRKKIEIVEGDFLEFDFNDEYFGALIQFPNAKGEIIDYETAIANAKSKNIYIAIASDILSLTLLKSPGEMGADVALGSTQRFGIPLFYGGPHAAYFATTEEFKRYIPGRIIGLSIDAENNPAYRMALQTREQHIKREKATSNICTSQSLLAIMAGMYAIYHGSDGLKRIARNINNFAFIMSESLAELGAINTNKYYFDTLNYEFDNSLTVEKIRKNLLLKNINLFYPSDKSVRFSVDETFTFEDAQNILNSFANALSKETFDIKEFAEKLNANNSLPEKLYRKSEYLKHPIFNRYRSEMELMRYIKKLENRDLSMTGSMIPLGSCTMKLNASVELEAITWSEFADIHPFVPKDQAEGYFELFEELSHHLLDITGFDAMTFQPNSGAQGEYAGLLAIRKYQEINGEGHRDIALIPASAHGTNPASAVMAGLEVVVVKCDENGNIDVDDLMQKAEQYKERLSCLMVTYPSTHGVFEEKIVEICDIVHKNGGLVFMDGANMNAQVGLTNPAYIGADVCHLNLHKTFAIPHGGGGPGVGPICVSKKLLEFLPTHPLFDLGYKNTIGTVASSPFGSAGILSISYAYIKLLGSKGLKKATQVAILNANYIKSRLEKYYDVLYVGKNGRVAHELIFDFRKFKHSCGIDVEDIAKRLMDYGFHAPTVSFPVPGTLMVEPTESESLFELERFIEAMIMIREEIEEIEKGNADKNNNVLKNAPHTIKVISSDSWNYPYSRQKAAFPTNHTKENKFWPFVSRINNAYGDRNLVCSCVPIEEYSV